MAENKKFKKGFGNPNSDVTLPTDPSWLKYTGFIKTPQGLLVKTLCSPSYREKFRERIQERELFEERKQLFNSYRKPKSSSGGTDWRMKKLIHKPPIDQPDLLTLEVRRLIAKRFQNTQEWIKEREKKDEANQKTTV